MTPRKSFQIAELMYQGSGISFATGWMVIAASCRGLHSANDLRYNESITMDSLFFCSAFYPVSFREASLWLGIGACSKVLAVEALLSHPRLVNASDHCETGTASRPGSTSDVR